MAHVEGRGGDLRNHNPEGSRRMARKNLRSVSTPEKVIKGPRWKTEPSKKSLSLREHTTRLTGGYPFSGEANDAVISRGKGQLGPGTWPKPTAKRQNACIIKKKEDCDDLRLTLTNAQPERALPLKTHLKHVGEANRIGLLE